MDNTKTEKQYPDFCVEVQGLDAEALRSRIVVLQKGLQESNDQEEADEELAAVKAQAKEMGAPYRDVRKAVKAKTAYIFGLLEEKGQ